VQRLSAAELIVREFQIGLGDFELLAAVIYLRLKRPDAGSNLFLSERKVSLKAHLNLLGKAGDVDNEVCTAAERLLAGRRDLSQLVGGAEPSVKAV
jgi:hypothetical protein